MQQIVDFILELERLKGVERRARPLGLERYENPAEHSWQIALLAWSLVPYAGAEIDIHRVVGMLLVHDIGEIDTGDTMVFVEGGWEERKAAELAAVPAEARRSAGTAGCEVSVPVAGARGRRDSGSPVRSRRGPGHAGPVEPQQ